MVNQVLTQLSMFNTDASLHMNCNFKYKNLFDENIKHQ